MPISFESVSFSYNPPSKRQIKAGETPKYALQDVTFTVREGEFLAIAGHTGSGKSTLTQHLNGLIHPTEGRVLWNGKDLTEKKNAIEARGDIGLVFQYPEHQLFAATVFEDVAFGPRNLGLNGAEVDERVRNALRSVDLSFEELRDVSPFELSGGQQRRVAFAGVLAMQPSVLVLDEPVAGLDPASRKDFIDLIDGLHRSGLTIIMVSHNMNDIARLADRVMVLNKGRIAGLGTPEEVFAHAADLRSIGLGVPHAQRMANELREKGMALPEALYSPESLADALASLIKGA